MEPIHMQFRKQNCTPRIACPNEQCILNVYPNLGINKNNENCIPKNNKGHAQMNNVCPHYTCVGKQKKKILYSQAHSLYNYTCR